MRIADCERSKIDDDRLVAAGLIRGMITVPCADGSSTETDLNVCVLLESDEGFVGDGAFEDEATFCSGLGSEAECDSSLFMKKCSSKTMGFIYRTDR